MPAEPESHDSLDGPVPLDMAGLSDAWEGDGRVRRPAIKDGSMLQWPSAKKVGVINFAAVSLNHHVIKHVLSLWCPQAEDRKTVPINLLKPEAGEWDGVETLQ